MAKPRRPKVLLVSRAFVRRRNGTYLLLQRAANDPHNPGKWECVGGKVEPGQDATRALLVEALEEAGIIILLATLLATYESHYITSGTYRDHIYLALFGIAEWVSGKVRLSHEHDDHAWVTYEQMFTYDLTDETRKAATALEKELR